MRPVSTGPHNIFKVAVGYTIRTPHKHHPIISTFTTHTLHSFAKNFGVQPPPNLPLKKGEELPYYVF
jgi:hypothetical protein